MQAMFNCVCVYVPLETVLKASTHRHCSTGAVSALSVFLYVKVAIFMGATITVRLDKMAANPRAQKMRFCMVLVFFLCALWNAHF